MIPKDFWEKHEHRKTLDRAIELAEEKFPKLEINVARDGGDVVELLLYDVEEYNHADHRVGCYNKWYDQMSFCSLTFTDDN